MFPDGSFVVVWQSFTQDGDAWGVHARRFASDGTAVADEFPVNLGTEGSQIEPAVGAAANGTFLVAYRDVAHGGIVGRAFDASDTPFGGDFPISDPTPFDEASPALAMDGDGDFVVAWTADGYDGSGYAIRARRFEGTFLFRDGFESGATNAWSFTSPP